MQTKAKRHTHTHTHSAQCTVHSGLDWTGFKCAHATINIVHYGAGTVIGD